MISAVRAAGAPVNNPRPLLAWIARLGMPLYGCETPDGYKNTTEAWLSPDATMQRIAFAAAFARGAVPVAMDRDGGLAALAAYRPAAADPKRLEAIFGSTLTPETRTVVDAAAPKERAALILGSPDFMRR